MKIKFNNICYHYNSKLPEQNEVLKDISFEISEGEFVGIIGPSGSGKTTLLQHFTGLLRPTSGKIFVDGKDIGTKNYPLDDLRKRIGLVFQFPENQLFEETVASDVAFGPKMLKLPEHEINLRVNEALRLVGMNKPEIKSRSPHQLSEGEKRRVAIAGVLAMAPEVLILDEPTACLDPAGVKRVSKILQQLHENGTTIVMITHSLDVIIGLAQRIIVLNEGEIKHDGTRESVFADADLLTSVNMELPRIVRLSKFLNHYEIIGPEFVFSMSELKKQIRQGVKITN